MSKAYYSIAFYISLVFMCGCVEPYYPEEISSAPSILVVDGYINTTAHSAKVTLSHSTALNATGLPEPERGASVRIERDDATQFALTETNPGSYQLDDMTLDLTAKYRLLIMTAAGKSYTSELIELTNTPNIDSVTWKAEEDGIRIYVNTHDPSGVAKYYMWNYDETWEHTAALYSSYKLIDGVVYQRAQDDLIFRCWTHESSTQIMVGNTERLSSEIITDLPLTFIRGGTIRLSFRYSILVHQQSLTKEGYEFWSQLQKLSEGLGGLFDSQPYQLLGNIRASENNETVLGFFSGGAVTEKRIFISYQELPSHLLRMRESPICGEDEIKAIYNADLPNAPNSQLLLEPISPPGGDIIGYTWADSYCLDCRFQGGVLVRPDFW